MVGMATNNTDLHQSGTIVHKVYDLTNQKHIRIINRMTPERAKMLSTIPMKEIRKTTKVLDNQ